MQSLAKASVLPAGTIPPSTSLAAGTHTLTITSVRANNELTLQYPDGFLRDHQAADMTELKGKIAMLLRARYGAELKSSTDTPIAEGAVITVEV